MKQALLLAGAVCASALSFGQSFELLNSPSEQVIRMSHDLVEVPSAFTSINSVDYRNFEKSHDITTQEAGAPALPYFSESVIIPNTGKATLVVSHDGYTEYQNVEISPSKGNLKRNVSPSSIPYTFGNAYNTDAFYPSQLAKLGSPYNLRNTRGATVSFYPYQYNPVTKVLRVYENLQAEIVMNPAETGINELSAEVTNRDVFHNVYDHHYLNAGEVFGRYTPVGEEGQMLIIAKDSYISNIEPLARWKTESGIKTTIVGTSTAGTTDQAIHTYIQNFYSSNSDLVYVLLVGDHADVPSHSYGTSGWEELWSDSYYGMLTGNDYYPEVFIGRFSGSANQINTMVERTLEYEKTPASGTWMARAIGLASDEGAGYGDDGEADWQHARNNRTKLMNYGYETVHEFYDGSHGGDDANGNPSAAIISPAVNEGIGLFNYTGHGDQTTCITGNYSSSNITAATNNGKYPFVISVACNNGTFTAGTCISETWMRAKNATGPTGAIAACGSSILMAWAQPMQTQDEMADIISETYANNRKHTLGGLFYNSQMSMLEDYNADNSSVEVMQTWVMFGDPSTMFRNQATQNMNVTHVGNVPLGTTSVDINCNVEGATVAVVQDGVLIGKGTVSGGVAAITFAALTSNLPLTVTATKQNYQPYQGVITVADGPAGLEDLLAGQYDVYPNPASDILNVRWNASVEATKIEMKDLSGKVVYSSTVNAANGTTSFSTATLATGIYLLQFEAGDQVSTTKVVLK